MKKLLFIFITALLIMCSAGGVSTDQPYIFSTLHAGNTVQVRMNAPEGGFVLLGVYDRATHQMRDIQVRETDPAPSTQILKVVFDRIPSSREYVVAFLVDRETMSPLCQAVLADYVISPSAPDDPGSEEPNPDEPDPDEEEWEYVLNTSSQTFHKPSCSHAKRISEANRQDYYGTRDSVLAMGYQPCGSCKP